MSDKTQPDRPTDADETTDKLHYNPVGMAGKKAGRVEELEDAADEREESDEEDEGEEQDNDVEQDDDDGGREGNARDDAEGDGVGSTVAPRR